jgi:hypothetical protein
LCCGGSVTPSVVGEPSSSTRGKRNIYENTMLMHKMPSN